MKTLSDDVKECDKGNLRADRKAEKHSPFYPQYAQSHHSRRRGRQGKPASCAAGASRKNLILRPRLIGTSARTSEFSTPKPPQRYRAPVSIFTEASAPVSKEPFSASFMDTHADNGYEEIIPPYLVNRASMTAPVSCPNSRRTPTVFTARTNSSSPPPRFR